MEVYRIPLAATLAIGGLPLLYDLLRKLMKREFGSDLLGGISIMTSVLLGEYLAGSIIVLMLAGGEALESYALRNASSVLAALAKRMPSVAHRKNDSQIVDAALHEVAIGDILAIYPHDICPVDGVVIEGHAVMDESYLTGEPFEITKTSGSTVISGAIQRRVGPYHSRHERRRRLALREDHAGHARVRSEPPRRHRRGSSRAFGEGAEGELLGRGISACVRTRTKHRERVNANTRN